MKEVKVLHNRKSKYVEASIVPITPDHIQNIELNWKPQLKEQEFWDHGFELSDYLNNSENTEIYVLERNFIAQGLLVFTTGCQLSRLQPNHRLLYLNWISVAPWNRMSIDNRSEHKGIGTALFTFAVQKSLNLGFEGRIGLHTVKQSEEFYQKLHLSDLGYDTFNSCRLKYLELSTVNAELILLDYMLSCYLN